MKASRLLLIVFVILTLLIGANIAFPKMASRGRAPFTATPGSAAQSTTKSPAGSILSTPTPVVNIDRLTDGYLASLPAAFGAIDVTTLNNEINTGSPFIVDVREPSEVASTGFINGAVNIPLRSLAKSLNKLPGDKAADIVVYCSTGHRGGIAMTTLYMLGFRNTRSLAGGFVAWSAAHMPVQSGAPGTRPAGPAASVDNNVLAILDAYLSNLPPDFGAIMPAELANQMATVKPYIFDMREVSERQTEGAIQGSISIPVRTLVPSIFKLPMDKAVPIVVYSENGHRGAQAMMALQLLGYSHVTSLEGGMTAWNESGLAVNK